SKAICSTLEQYNAATATRKPPRRDSASCERAVECAFLSDFDLLRDVRRDMSRHRWATPAGHKVMDTYFKICRTKEEIRCLKIEIQ
ncbi:hypothetical protein F5146DRAFT_887854, partial [Armillaria mellea]